MTDPDLTKFPYHFSVKDMNLDISQVKDCDL